MYGIGPDVANVTANGEQIVRVTELGLCSFCMYGYDNSKSVDVEIEDGKITEVTVSFYGENDRPLWYKNYNDLTEEEKEEYIPKAEYELVTQNAIKRYEADHNKKRKTGIKTGYRCNIL